MHADYIFKYGFFWSKGNGTTGVGGGIGLHTSQRGTVSLVGHSVACCQQQPATQHLTSKCVPVGVIMSATHWRPEDIAPFTRNVGQNVIKGALTSNN